VHGRRQPQQWLRSAAVERQHTARFANSDGMRAHPRGHYSCAEQLGGTASTGCAGARDDGHAFHDTREQDSGRSKRGPLRCVFFWHMSRAAGLRLVRRTAPAFSALGRHHDHTEQPLASAMGQPLHAPSAAMAGHCSLAISGQRARQHDARSLAAAQA
jgi:hypothetical protein